MGKLLSIRLIELVVYLYDLITLPLYYVIQRPWKVRLEATRIRARQVDEFTWANVESKLHQIKGRDVDTLDQMFRDSVASYAARRCLGVRKILALEYRDSPVRQPLVKGAAAAADSVDSAGAVEQRKRVIYKYVLDKQYTWYTFEQIERTVIELSAGLIGTCSESLRLADGHRRMLICADTCMEWFLMAHACFRNNVTVVTAYTTLDDDAILHIIHQTEVKILVACQKFARRLGPIVSNSPLIDTVIMLDEPLPGQVDEIHGLRETLHSIGDGSSNLKRIISYRELVVGGQQAVAGRAGGGPSSSSSSQISEQQREKEEAPSGDDIAVLMYTSGSTGKAKGVMLSHKSIVYTALSFSGPGDISHKDRYIGYLPLGHVLELAAECIFLRNGSTIAYSSPLTLTNASPMIKKGQFGDAYIFKPTIMAVVPLILDRIKSAIQQSVKQQGPFYDQLINDFLIRYKRYWFERYYDTPIMNRILCKRFNMILGGQIRAICSGGAALSRETHEYLRHVTNNIVLQGYGLTETSAAASFCDLKERRYNVVGAPYPIVHIRLESWSDYSVKDKPHPRGEVIIGGQPVSAGYFKLDELTREAFFVDPKSGIRYFRTGDIGVMLPDGVLKIIDRKKDLVKPLSGEYISLNEIETAMRTASIVDNICVYCSPYSNYIVAIVKVELKELKPLAVQLFSEITNLGEKFHSSVLETLATQHGIDRPQVEAASIREHIDLLGSEYLCSNKWLVERVLHLLQDAGNQRRLKKTHIPSKIKLVVDEWSPESGLVAASFKLRRREVERHYARDIEQLYSELGQKISQDL